jgi:alpha-L-fucosidase
MIKRRLLPFTLGALAGLLNPALAVERGGPADAYGGGKSSPQPAAPEQAKEVFRIPAEIAPGPFKGDWASFTPDKLKPEPDWWREAKIGVWFHWGPQSMGRNGDWYARFLYQEPPGGRKGRANNRYMYDEHLRRFGHPSEFGYMDVLNAWKAPQFDPNKLMDLYASCGARYILVQGAHHDNFDLWNSKYQPWNSVNVGPKRDIVGEMFGEARKRGFRVGMAFHADYSLWWYQPAFGSDRTGPKRGVPYDAATRTKGNGKGKWWEGLDPKDLYGIDLEAETLPGKDIRGGFFTPVRDLFTQPATRAFAKEYCLKWFNRIKQFVDDYDPDFIYTDGTEPFTGRGTAKGVISDATVKVVAHMYNKRHAKNSGEVDCMAVIKGGPKITGVAAPHEGGYTGPIKRTPWVWEDTCGEWFFEDNTFYSARPMVLQMIEAICRDGNFNLNISLTPEGALEPGGEKMWRDFGRFLQVNGEAIYGSRAWKVLGEGRELVDPRKPGSKPALVCFPRSGILPQHDAFVMTTQDIRFTEGKDGSIYAFVMAVPKPGETITLKALGTSAKLLEKPVQSVSLLGAPDKLEWELLPEGLSVKCPSATPFHYAVVFKIRAADPLGDATCK